MHVLPLPGRRIRRLRTYTSPSFRYAPLFLSPDDVSVRTGINVCDAFISLWPTHPVRPSLSSQQILAVPAFPSSFILLLLFLSLVMHIVASRLWPWKAVLTDSSSREARVRPEESRLELDVWESHALVGRLGQAGPPESGTQLCLSYSN